MNRTSLRTLVALTVSLVAFSVARAQAPAADLSAAIDRLLIERWNAAQAKPAPPAADAEFLRRVYLDLTGKIPTVGETREFLKDARPDKRQRLVDKLLKSGVHDSHFARVWRDILLPDKDDPASIANRSGFEAWLLTRLTQNVGYDRMVKEILTAQVPQAQRGRGLPAIADGNADGSPLGFYIANENKPENLAGSTARLFLAVKLECAQCHNHPFAKWSREQFWEYAAFFAALDGRGKARQIKIPDLNQVVSTRFLDGTKPEAEDRTDSRVLLANWMTRPDNPYFARAVVNRMWAYFLGTGLVEPIDDLTRENEKDPLLDELARQFVQHGYDLKYLMRGIVMSRVYGLTSRTARADETPRNFTQMAVRGLAPEQVFDSLIEATRFENVPPQARLEFLARFANANERKVETQTSILQALALMNGRLIGDATSLERSAILGALEAPFYETADRIEVLYLATLSRMPRPEETARLVQYIDKGGPSGNPRQALADVFWALLNSSEFLFNH